jgi:nuclease S1
MTRLVRLAVGLVALLATAKAAHGWGDDGHRIICRIATSVLGEADRREVERLARAYRAPDGTRFAHYTDACTFADVARGKARLFADAVHAGNSTAADRLAGWRRFGAFDAWHFINVPRTARVVRMTSCHDDCVLKAIATHRRVRAAASTQERAEALILLGHWVGDVHQPLHVSFADDRGGNDVDRIKGGFYSSPDLHAVWDSGIIAKARAGRGWSTYARELIGTIDEGRRREWMRSEPIEWANESYRITIEHDVHYCAREGATCRSEGRTRTLRASYQERFQPVVERRLEQAGVRLAKLLAAALHDGHEMTPASFQRPISSHEQPSSSSTSSVCAPASCAPRATAGGAPPNWTGFAQTRTDVPSGAGESTR